MLIWIWIATALFFAIVNVYLAFREDELIDKYSSDVMKIIRELNLAVEIPNQVPLNHIQKLRVIENFKKFPEYNENEVISENASVYRKIGRLRNCSGFIVVGIILIPLLLKQFL